MCYNHTYLDYWMRRVCCMSDNHFTVLKCAKIHWCQRSNLFLFLPRDTFVRMRITVQEITMNLTAVVNITVHLDCLFICLVYTKRRIHLLLHERHIVFVLSVMTQSRTSRSCCWHFLSMGASSSKHSSSTSSLGDAAAYAGWYQVKFIDQQHNAITTVKHAC